VTSWIPVCMGLTAPVMRRCTNLEAAIPAKPECASLE
jgi:hypothetical protein